ncbi:MAG: hypothetical protein KIT25_09745 [Enhydrobacter sp.]|nr:MAG: hypothetical protein KIT25_09745 [Enhydrobacter sp.]
MRGFSTMALVLALGACAQQPADTSRRDANPERYERDRSLCRAQVDDEMRTRRMVDDSRRDVFSGDRDRYGQGDLSRTMAAYGDTRSFDRMMSTCMEARGWPQSRPNWWQRIGS